jgi:HPt (histidine-containing phosphotransfer) domain-containing protein
MTAHAMSGDHEKSLAAGMVDHVTKPIDPDHLFATLGKWIRPREVPPTAVDPETGVSGPSAPGIAPAPLDRAAAGAADSELPDMLPGFDLSDGLRRLQGNRKLYRKLLINFAAGYANTGAEIRQALDALDFGQAHSLVHSLKGVAGNLSAGGLQAATVELEKLVKHADKNEPPPPDTLNSRLAALENALDQALEAARTLKPLQVEAAGPVGGPAPALPPEVAQKAARRLRAAAEMGDVTEVVSIADEITSQAKGFSPYRAKIARLADDFDFDGILQLTDELENSADIADS